MTQEQFNRLKPGDVVQHVHADGALGAHTWIVSANYGYRVTLVETADATNPEEWEIVSAG